LFDEFGVTVRETDIWNIGIVVVAVGNQQGYGVTFDPFTVRNIQFDVD
jgi:hypothetical protein